MIALTAATAHARDLRGVVFDDRNGDGVQSSGEPGVAAVVVALGTSHFTTTDGLGRFRFDLADDAGDPIAWARVPDGFVPGPVWASTANRDDISLALHRLATPLHGALTFVVAADTHLSYAQPFFGDLAAIAHAAVIGDPPPAFFTILGDITQGNQAEQFALVDDQLAGLGVPYVPVPGNHDWYDDGATWFSHYGPDNYSFDIGRAHFVVWNMNAAPDDIARYLGAELARVSSAMTIVALTHAPPTPATLDVLRELGVDYVLTGHTHTNRAIAHDGLIELTTEPLLMGGLDGSPAGYRVVTLAPGPSPTIAVEHRTISEPRAVIVAPTPGHCIAASSPRVVVAATANDGVRGVTARVDCATPLALAPHGGWSWVSELPRLAPGPHTLAVESRLASGRIITTATTFDVCAAPWRPATASATAARWPQAGGDPDHSGATARVVAPPLAAKWTAVAGGHLIAPPIASDGVAVVATADYARGNGGGITAIDLATGAVRWRAATDAPVHGPPAIANGVVAIADQHGTVRGYQLATGNLMWRYELGVARDGSDAPIAPEAANVFAGPASDGRDLLIGNQRHFAVLDSESGRARWTTDPVPGGLWSQSLASVAVGDQVVVGVFHRELGGIVAWDRASGRELWRFDAREAIAINATPAIDNGIVYVANGSTDVLALELATGELRWQTRLHDEGFAWGNAIYGGLAIAHGVVVVPTLYDELVALDAAAGGELWRVRAAPSPLRTTHYRGANLAGFASAPVITGDVVWAVDTSGQLIAIALADGAVLWRHDFATPVLGGLAVAGDALVMASYDGSLRLLTPPESPPIGAAIECEVATSDGGGCCGAGQRAPNLLAIVIVALVLQRKDRRTPRETGAKHAR